MISYALILERGWPGQAQSLSPPPPVPDGDPPRTPEEEFAATLWWDAANTLPKPTLAEVEAKRAEVEAQIALEEKQERQQRELMTRDSLLTALDVVVDAVKDLQSRVNGVPAQQKNRINTLSDRIAQIKAIT